MTHTEIRKVFEKKMNEAVASIKNTKNGDIEISTVSSSSYGTYTGKTLGI